MTKKYRTRHEKNREETRQIIFQTAYALLEEKGYNGITIRELASKAGVGLGTIFQHFKDKASLLVSIFEYDFHPYVEDVFDSLPATGLKSQLKYMVDRFYCYYAERPQISMIMIKELYVGSKNININQTFQKDLIKIAALFDAAKKRGEIDSCTDVKDAAALWWAYYSSVLLQGFQMHKFDVNRQLAVYNRLLDQHFMGIQARR